MKDCLYLKVLNSSVMRRSHVLYTLSKITEIMYINYMGRNYLVISFTSSVTSYIRSKEQIRKLSVKSLTLKAANPNSS